MTQPLPTLDLEPEGVSDDPSRSALSLLIRALTLFCAEGVSVGLFLWALASSPDSLPSSLEDGASFLDRTSLLGATVGAGALAVFFALVALSAGALPNLHRFDQVARRLAPLLLLGALPFLFRWRFWYARELTYVVFVSLLGFGVQRALLCSFRSPPLFGARLLPASRVCGEFVKRLTPWLPLILVLIGVLYYSAFFSYHTIANHRNLRTASLDLGLENNLLWNLVHGGPFMKSSPLSGPTGSHFGYHATFFAYLIGLFYVLVPRPETLLVFQSVVLGLAALPLFFLGRRYVGTWSASLIAIAYLLYPPLHGANLYDFHYLPLGIFFLWMTVYLVESERYRWAALFALLAISIREDVAAGLGVLGAYLLLSGRKPRAGLILAVLGTGYFVALKLVIMPRVLGEPSFVYMFVGLLPQGDTGFGGVLKTAIGNPIFTLTSLLTREKLLYLCQIGAPLCFFAWRRPIGLLCTVPGFFFTLLSTGYLPLIQISFQYTTHWTVFLFVAVLANLAWVRRPRFPGDFEGTARQRAWVASIGLLTLLTSYQYGAIFQQNTARGGFGPYIFQTTDQDRDRYAKLMTLIDQIPKHAKVVSSENIVPHISNRPDSYTLRIGIFDAEYLLFSLPVYSEESTQVRAAFSSGFGVMKVSGPFVLAKRGYSNAKNQSVLRQVR